MHAKFRSMLAFVALVLAGCPRGTPRDHLRPHGHQDTTLAVSSDDEALVFNASGMGGRDLYRLRLKDLAVTRIAETPEYEVTPSISADGQRIVYAAGVPGDRADHLFIMGIDGSAKRQLTNADANDTTPRFSPDGQLIVFARDKTYNWGGLAANWELGGVICVVQVDGSGERQLTPDEIFAFAPAFSADGMSVIYFTDEGCFSLAVDGSGPTQRVGPVVRDATLSPDGKRLVYSAGQYSPEYQLFVAQLDGRGKTKITRGDHGCFHPVFSRRGDRVCFLREEWPSGPSGEPKSSIWMVNADGTQQKQLTDLSLFDDPQNWRPLRSSDEEETPEGQ